MSSERILEGKKAIVNEITEKMQNAESFVLVDYQGRSVEHATALRKIAREAGVDYKVYKNTFMRFAAKACGYDELTEVLEGITAVAFCDSDAVAPAKVIYDYATANKLQTLKFKGGVVEKKVTSAEEVSSIAQLPSKDAMIARVLGSMNAPISNFVYALDAIRKQKEEATA